MTFMAKKLQIVADENIPSLPQLLTQNVELRFIPGRQIQPADLQQADVLLVRSVTQVNAALLEGSQIAFVGSCTIGTDHIDLDYLQRQGIAFANAPGCNADAVVDYVLAAMFSYQADMSYFCGKTAGIVGLGQVGTRLSSRLSALGMKVLAYDPFVDAATATYEQVLAADIVSFHVPITRSGDFPTYHMLAANELKQLKPGAVLINSCRGQVFDNQALQQFIDRQSKSEASVYTVLDVYEDEPSPNEKLLLSLDVATAHIAGYSQQGKIRGSLQVVMAMLAHFKRDDALDDLLALTRRPLKLDAADSAASWVKAAYDIKADSEAFLTSYLSDDTNYALLFDQYRKHYPVRTEFSYFDVCMSDEKIGLTLSKLGFHVL
ncbi:MAG: 4-phosphoerythronate dehydrogenase [Pseudomonadales bacterium]|nr:4-phosphoerythronate dehydrogenase [Pseudomonadales bacterium]